jgi:hypothetical protein
MMSKEQLYKGLENWRGMVKKEEKEEKRRVGGWN